MLRISRESWLLLTLCIADALFTVWLLVTGAATEANPILGFYLQAAGIGGFLGAKLLLSVGPVLALEVIRRHHPRFVQGLLRAGIALYLMAYVVGVWRMNYPPGV